MDGAKLVEYLGTLKVTQGDHAGRRFEVLPWERDFVVGMAGTGGDAALTVARGNGKTALVAALATAAVDPVGPLHIPRAEVVIVASSFAQGKLTFEDIVAFLRQKFGQRLNDRAMWRIQDSQNAATIEYRRTGARVRCIGSDPKRAHGLRPLLAIMDEPAQWDRAKAPGMYSAMLTGLGKVEGSRAIALGTRPADPSHFFARMLGTADYRQVHAAAADAAPFDRATWLAANPSLPHFPALEQRLQREAKLAAGDAGLLASFKALRLNQGISDTLSAMLISAEVWERSEGEAAMRGSYVLGVDAGQNAAMSAAAAYWPDTGALRAVAAFPENPSLQERGLKDGCGRDYMDMMAEGSLIQAGAQVSDLGGLLGEARARWGNPRLIVCDHWREAELRQTLDAARFPGCPLATRGQGYKDGGQDVRDFRAAIIGGGVTPERTLLLRAAFGNARVVSDTAGNWKLAKAAEGGRYQKARDDAAAAAVLAVSAGARISRRQAALFGDSPRMVVAR